MPVGNASDGVGLFAGQIMFSANMNIQYIDWGHDPVDPEDFDHFGTLQTTLIIPSVTIGLSDYWNVNYTQFIGIREMGWGPHNESVHHRTESSLEDFDNAKGGLFGDGKLKFQYLLNNVGMQAGNRTFIGFGLSIPSDNILTSDPFFLSELEENGGGGIDNEEWLDGNHNHRHFALSDGNYKGIIEIQYFNKRKSNPVFWGIKFDASLPFKDSDYGYDAGNSYNLALSALFKPNIKIITNPIGISSGIFLAHLNQGYWNNLPDPTSKSTVLVLSIGSIWKLKKGALALNVQKPLLIDGVGAGSENALNNTFDAIELTIGYRYMLDYVIPWLYF